MYGGQQEKGFNFWKTYAPVVNWFSIRLLLAKAVMSKWYTRQIDFISAYPQTDIETELFMKLPRGIELSSVSNDLYCLRLKKNIYFNKSFEVYADADFCGNISANTAHVDSATAKSRSGYAVTLHGAPVIWHSKLISQICLSTTEAEYCCSSQSLRDTIQIMNLCW